MKDTENQKKTTGTGAEQRIVMLTFIQHLEGCLKGKTIAIDIGCGQDEIIIDVAEVWGDHDDEWRGLGFTDKNGKRYDGIDIGDKFRVIT